MRNTKKAYRRKTIEKGKLRKRLGGIRAKLILVFIVPVVLIVILGAVSYQKSSKGLIENYEQAALSSMNTLGDYFQLGFSNFIAKAKIVKIDQITNNYYAGVYQKDPLNESDKFAQINKLVRTNVIADRSIENISIFANYGEGICSNGKISLECYDLFNQSEEMKEFLASGESEAWLGEHPVLDQQIRLNSDKYAISYVCELPGVGKNPIGYVVLDVAKEFVVDKIDKLELSVGSLVNFITKDKRELKQTKTQEGYSFLETTYYENALNSENSCGYEYIKNQGKEYLFVYSKMEESGSILCALIPKSEIIKQAVEVKQLTITITLIAILIAVIIGTVVASRISKAIQTANLVLGKTATGDLTQKLTLSRKDEFKDLSDSVNHTIQGMKELILQMSDISNVVSTSTQDLFSNSNLLLSTTKDITMGVNQIESGVSMQAVDTGNCLQMMEELSEQIAEVYGAANKINVIAGNAKEVAHQGTQMIDLLNEKSKETAEITDIITRSVQDLKQESSIIGTIVNTINDISEQSNLLSLNASIEAARAGAYGNGFMVVAEEIRKLAQKSSESVLEIHKIIQNEQTKTDHTVDLAKKAELIVKSQEMALNETIQIFSSINDQVEKLSNHITEISCAIDAIEQSKNGTLNAIENITTTSQETAAISQELGAATENQLKAVEALNQAASQLEKDSYEMQDAVGKFRLS